MKELKKKYNFNLVVNKTPFTVEVIPFAFNEETRLRIFINGGEEHIYAWDEDAVQLTALDDSATDIPEELEIELSNQLVKTVVLK